MVSQTPSPRLLKETAIVSGVPVMDLAWSGASSCDESSVHFCALNLDVFDAGVHIYVQAITSFINNSATLCTIALSFVTTVGVTGHSCSVVRTQT